MGLRTVARYYRGPEGGLGEMALTIHDEFQGQGLGSGLFKRLCDLARSRGLKGFYGYVLASNFRMLRVFHGMGLPVKTELSKDGYRVTLEFAAP